MRQIRHHNPRDHQPALRGRWVWIALTTCLVLAALRLHWMPCLVTGRSMEPTLASGDWVLLDRHAYRHQPPQRGDIVVARVGRERLIKRIVGLPGETVEIRKGHLFVNDQPAPEPHPILSGPLDIAKGHLRPDHYALLGDNRTVSDLLPLHLIVHRDQVLGKVIAVLPLGTFFKSAPRHEPAPPGTHAAAT